MKRLVCRLIGHDFCIPIFGARGREIGKYCWRCGERWPK